MSTPERDLHVDAHRLISTQLAHDLTSGLYEREVIFEKYGITPELWEVVRKSPRFRSMMVEAMGYWNGRDGADRRIRAKAKMMLEELLPDLFNMATDKETGVTTRLAAVERIQKLSGIDADTANPGASGPIFAVTINLGDGESMNISGNTAKVIEHEAIPADAE